MSRPATRRLPLAGFFLILATQLSAQDDDPQRMTLTGLRHFAVHARVQLSGGTSLERIEERGLREKLESGIRQAGIGVVGDNDVRDGTQAEIGLQYLVIGTRNQPGGGSGFVASSCIEAAQLVKLQRVTRSGAPVYAVVPTWRSCGFVLGDSGSYRRRIGENADQQIDRFIRAWRQVNAPPSPSHPPVESREPRVGSQTSSS